MPSIPSGPAGLNAVAVPAKKYSASVYAACVRSAGGIAENGWPRSPPVIGPVTTAAARTNGSSPILVSLFRRHDPRRGFEAAVVRVRCRTRDGFVERGDDHELLAIHEAAGG